MAEVARVRAEDALRPVVVLAPTFLLCQHLKRRLAAAGTGHAGVRFLTMAELARVLAERAMRSEGRSPLPDGASLVLWRRAVAALPPGGFFERIRGAHGFPAAARATIRDLKEAGLTPSVLERRAVGDSRLARKLRDLVVLWRRVEQRVAEAGFHDDLDLFREAAELAAEAPFLEGAAAFLYGFYDLPRAQRRLVEGFLKRGIAAAFVPWGDDDDTSDDRAFAYAESTRDFLQGTLELHPDDDAVPVTRPPPAFSVIAAPGEAREALEIARVIGQDAGTLRETGVLLRASSVQGPLLDETFEDAGIPRFLVDPVPLGRLPAARALSLMLEARRQDFPRTLVMEILTTARVRFSDLIGDAKAPVTPGVWDVLAREWGIVGGTGEWRARLQAGIRELERDVLRQQDDLLDAPSRPGAADRLKRAQSFRALIETLLTLLGAIPERAAWSAIAVAIGEVFERVFDAGPDLHHVRAVIAAVARLDALGARPDGTWAADGTGTLAEVGELIGEALAAASPAEERFEGPGVLVGDLMKVRGIPFRTVIVPGMIEGVFPRIARPDPLLTDHERRQLNVELASALDGPGAFALDDVGDDDGGEADLAEDLGADGPLALKGASAAEERLLFRLCLDAASERVVFTLPRLDPATGRDRVPSWLLMKLLERVHDRTEALTVAEFAKSPEVRWVTLDPRPSSPEVAVHALERELADLSLALDGGNVLAAARLMTRSPFGRAVIAAERARWGEKRFTAYDGWIAPPANASDAWRDAVAKAALKPGREMSPTRLESFVKCPYRYFLKYALGLDPLEEPERRMTIDPRDRGELIHKVLEKFWHAEKIAKRLPLREADLPEALARLAAIYDVCVAEFEANGITGPKLLWDAEKGEMSADVAQAVTRTVTLDEAEGWAPAEFELGFGEESSAAATAAAAAATLGAPRGARKKSSAGSRQMSLFDSPAPAAEAGAGRVSLPDANATTEGAAPFLFRGRIDRVDFTPGRARGRVVDYKTGRNKVRFTARGKAEPKVFHGGAALQLPIYVLAAKQRFPEVKDWEAVYDYCTRRGEFDRAAIPVDDGVLTRLSELVSWISNDTAAGKYPFIADDEGCKFCDYREVCGPAHDIAFEVKSASDEFSPFLERGEVFK